MLSQGMDELAPLRTGAATDRVMTAPLPKPGPGCEGTATAVVASLQGCGSLSKSMGDVPLLSLITTTCLCRGWYPAPNLHPRNGGGSRVHPLPAASSLSQPQIKEIHYTRSVCVRVPSRHWDGCVQREAGKKLRGWRQPSLTGEAFKFPFQLSWP